MKIYFAQLSGGLIVGGACGVAGGEVGFGVFIFIGIIMGFVAHGLNEAP